MGDVEATALGEDDLARLRREWLGFIFQSLRAHPGAHRRGETSRSRCGSRAWRRPNRDRRVADALAVVDSTAQAPQRPGELSGGQQQRVGIARAIVADPRIVIADEPTGQLDSRTAATIMDLLVELTHTQGIAAIVATHDPLLVARADRVIDLHGGRVTGTLEHDEIPDAADDGVDADPWAAVAASRCRPRRSPVPRHALPGAWGPGVPARRGRRAATGMVRSVLHREWTR